MKIWLCWNRICHGGDRFASTLKLLQATNTNDRREILCDWHFWLQLEYMASGWLAGSPEEVHRQYWIDGFQPESIINTKTDMAVTGYVWMMGRHGGHWQFFAEVPQKLVHRRTRSFQIEKVWVDEDKKVLELRLEVTGGSGPD